MSDHMNGPANPSGKFIDSINTDDPEYRRNLQRPAEVKEDMKQMEGRSRVSVVLNSQAFKEELEEVIQEQIRQGGPASIFALQQITDLLIPPGRGGNSSSFGRASPGIPINDIRGVETLGYTKQEKILRCKLAACYRLVDLHGWTHGIFNHISARLSQEQEQFLVNPFGMLYPEVTASTLVKVDVRGEVVDTGSTGLGISRAAFTLHAAIHQARPDIRCIIHLHTPSAVAVSATKAGLLPLSQEALICGKVSYHDYRGILVDQEEKDQLTRNLGPFNKVMFLRNHGIVACGETIEEAFHYAFNVMAAVDVQVKAMPVGLDNLVLVDEETQDKTFKVGSMGGGGTDTSGRKWRCGELEWDALMRTLDNGGYRTGHIYKQPLMKQEKKERIHSDVEVPPASSSFTYIFDGDYEHSKYVSPIKMAMERQKQNYKAGWLTSPNTYKKEEIEEIGTTTPKKITKWVTGDSSMQRSTAVKVDSPNVFAPQGSNPKEFKDKQKSIRKDYYEEKVTAGPQSRILEGISWDEAAKMKEGGDQTVVVGAASKGIIQRDHQHNAVVYRSYYAANPFENMSEDEVNAYKQEVERRERGEEPDDEPGPDGRLISTEERMQHIQISREDVHDTEANTPQETNLDSVVNGDKPVKKERSQPPPVSPKAAWGGDPLAPGLDKEGLGQLADTMVTAVLTAALRKGQRSPGEDWSGVGASTPPLSPPPPPPSSASGVPSRSSSSSFPPPPSSFSDPPQTTCPEGDEGTQQTVRVKTNTVKVVEAVDDGVERGVCSDPAPEQMVVQLQPVKLFQGQPGDGVMKISFTIQSKVTRRRTQGPKGSWPIEDVTIMQSQPKVTMVPQQPLPSPSEKNNPGKRKANVLQEQQQNTNSSTVSYTATVEKEELRTQSSDFLLYQVAEKTEEVRAQSSDLLLYQVAENKEDVGSENSELLLYQVTEQEESSGGGGGEGEGAPPPPRSPLYQQRPAKRQLLPRRRQTTGGKQQGKPKKRPRWLRRGLTHPLSPVREEFLEGEDTLEALLARQNVDVDTDESLEDLLLMTDNYKENVSPVESQDGCHDVSRPLAAPDKPAPIATLEDLDETCLLSPVLERDETGLFSPVSERSEAGLFFPMSERGDGVAEGRVVSPAQEPVFVIPKHVLTHPAPKFPSQDQKSALSKGQDADYVKQVEEENGRDVESETKIKDFEGDIKFVDEEVSSTYFEASDGDINPRKQEEAVEKTPLSDAGTASPLDKKTSSANEDNKEIWYEAKTSASEPDDDAAEESDGPIEMIAPVVVEEIAPVIVEPSFSQPKAKPKQTLKISAPLALQEDDEDLKEDVSNFPASSASQSSGLPPLYRSDSASLEDSPIVSSPPYTDLHPDPIHRELHRVRSLENELDDPAVVTKRVHKGRSTLRRVHSAGPVPHSHNRKTTVIDSTFRTVTIDPAKITQSGKPMSTYLLESPAGKGEKGRWTLMDTVSKSVEELDADDLDGVMIYGKSLEVLIHDADQQPGDGAYDPDRRASLGGPLEDLLEDTKSKLMNLGGGAKLYKEDVVVIAKKPLDFSAISPQTKKDLAAAEEEGPLVTSSPKLGRRKEGSGSFKKYQSKMGKSEETLLEVTPLASPEGSPKKHKGATRSLSTPKNFGLKKNRSQDALLLDDHPSLFADDDDRQREGKRSTQSVSTLDEKSRSTWPRGRGTRSRSRDKLADHDHSPAVSNASLDTRHHRHAGRRNRSKDLTDQSPALSNDSLDNQRQSGHRSRGRVRSKETLIHDDVLLPPTQSSDVLDKQADERADRPLQQFEQDENERRRPRRSEGQEAAQPEGTRRRRSRRRAAQAEGEMESSPPATHRDSVVDNATSEPRSSRRDRRRRRQRGGEDQARSPVGEQEYRSTADRRLRSPVYDRQEQPSEDRKSRSPRSPVDDRKDQPSKDRKSSSHKSHVDDRKDEPSKDRKSRSPSDNKKERSTENKKLKTQAGEQEDPPTEGRMEEKHHQTEPRTPTTPIAENSELNTEDGDDDYSEVPEVVQVAPPSEAIIGNTDSIDMEDLPPPPPELLEDISGDKSAEALTDAQPESAQEKWEEPAHMLDENEENMPPRVRKPKKKEKLSKAALASQSAVEIKDEKLPREKSAEEIVNENLLRENSAEEIVDKNLLRKKPSKETIAVEAPVEEATFMSSFKKPVRKSQTVGEDFPSLSAKQQVMQQLPHTLAVDDTAPDTNTTKERPINKLVTAEEAEGTVPIAGNLDMVDHGDEPPPLVRAQPRDSDQDSQTSKGRRRSERRSKRSQESEPRDREPRDRGPSDRAPELEPKLRDTRASRDSLASSKGGRRDFGSVDLDIVNYDDGAEPPRVRRRAARHSEPEPRNDNDDTRSEISEASTRPRSEGRLKGRREGRNDRRSDNEKGRRRGSHVEEDLNLAPPKIRLQTASRESLDRVDSAPPLPPKLHRSTDRLSEYDLQSNRSRSREFLSEYDPQPSRSQSREFLSEYDREPGRARSREFLNQPAEGRQDAPPELPPKKNKKNKLSCVGGPDMESEHPKKSGKDKKSKDRSSSKDRKKMPPPPASPTGEIDSLVEEPRRRGRREAARDDYANEPRRRGQHDDSIGDFMEEPRRRGHREESRESLMQEPRRLGSHHEESRDDFPQEPRRRDRHRESKEDFSEEPRRRDRPRESKEDFSEEPRRRDRHRESKEDFSEEPRRRDRLKESREDFAEDPRRRNDHGESRDYFAEEPRRRGGREESKEDYREEPRRRGRGSQLLAVPTGDSFVRDSSFDTSLPRSPTDGTFPYYGDTEDELDGHGGNSEKKSKKNASGDPTVSPPQTPKSMRKVSTGSYGSVTPRKTRSVSFNDGYTPTMSHPPRRQNSRESLGSQSSLHSAMGSRMRSHSGASETSLSSNPLNHDPWRVKAASNRPQIKKSRRSHSQGEPTYSANAGRRRRSRTPSAGDSNRLYQPRKSRSRGSLFPEVPEVLPPGKAAAPSQLPSKYRDTSLLADDSFSDALSHGYASESLPVAPVRRSESERHPEKSRQLIKELEGKGIGRSHSDRRPRGEGDGGMPGSPSKSDTMDSASGGETLEERSSKEGSPTKEAPSPTKEKKKKKKFRMPSFSKKKKDSKESTI